MAAARGQAATSPRRNNGDILSLSEGKKQKEKEKKSVFLVGGPGQLTTAHDKHTKTHEKTHEKHNKKKHENTHEHTPPDSHFWQFFQAKKAASSRCVCFLLVLNNIT